jgi:hypothetical protein
MKRIAILTTLRHRTRLRVGWLNGNAEELTDVLPGWCKIGPSEDIKFSALQSRPAAAFLVFSLAAPAVLPALPILVMTRQTWRCLPQSRCMAGVRQQRRGRVLIEMIDNAHCIRRQYYQ